MYTMVGRLVYPPGCLSPIPRGVYTHQGASFPYPGRCIPTRVPLSHTQRGTYPPGCLSPIPRGVHTQQGVPLPYPEGYIPSMMHLSHTPGYIPSMVHLSIPGW